MSFPLRRFLRCTVFLWICSPFVIYCYRSVAHVATMSFTSWILYVFHVLLTPLHVPLPPTFTLSDALFRMYIVHHEHSNEFQRFF